MSLLKKILVILWFLLTLVACQPHLTYDELHEALETAETPEARESIETRIENFERTADRAAAHYENRAACQRGKDVVWFCNGDERYSERNPPKDTDELVRAYRNDRHICWCTKRDQLMQQF